jgi:3-methyladenine DNA glycosylase AlkD
MMRRGGTAHHELARELRAAAAPERAAGAASFFKTGPGQYGDGDVFLGVTVPVLRRLALKYRNIPLEELEPLLEAPEHELRSAALEILVDQHKRADPKTRKAIQDFYLANTRHINNWDLVDLSCREIVGGYLRTRPRKLLDRLAASPSLWERRIAMVSTMSLVRSGEFDDAIRTAERLLSDKHDLIHKAIGWVLRELGDQDRAVLVGFLQKHYARIPRTALRYAIEHFPADQRKQILKGDFTGLF